jgi:PAS domain S-box-containing protein
LRKAGASLDTVPSLEAWQKFVESVDKTYEDTDLERYTLERSARLFSDEMNRLHAKVESERDQMRLIFDQAPIGMVRAETDDRISMVNPALVRMLGYSSEELLTCNALVLVHPDERQVVSDSLTGLRAGRVGPAYTGTRRLLHRDGSVVHANISVSLVTDAEGKPLFTVGLVEDISEKVRLEVELRHAQKLESVGRLAAGIAHEINTPIQFVGDNAEFLRGGFVSLLDLCATYRSALDELGEAVPAAQREALAAAAEAADYDYLRERGPAAFDATLDGAARVANIVRAMKSFAHPDQPGKVAADVNEALRSTLTVGSNELKYVADVVTDLAPLPPLQCHISDLNQVFLNLLINAAHAVADVVGTSGARGTISVRTLQRADEIVVAVEDTGTGIPEAIRGRIFDPFFTTKDVGRGSGQGLAISRAVVERHGGTLTFDTVVGKGTTFWVRLPIVLLSAEAA